MGVELPQNAFNVADKTTLLLSDGFSLFFNGDALSCLDPTMSIFILLLIIMVECRCSDLLHFGTTISSSSLSFGHIVQDWRWVQQGFGRFDEFEGF